MSSDSVSEAVSADVQDDAALVARLRSGDRSALDGLFRRHAADLLRLVSALVDDDADDVVQDVFVGLSLALRGYEERGTFAAWLRGVTVRTALSRRRRAAQRRETVLASTLASANDPDPSTGIALGDALRRLPDSSREIFVLKFVEGYSHAEIAELLDIRAGTSEVRLFRAIRRLRSLLSDHH
jgi:RNA polymerase sigma-70 factor (ECF subfamily)